MYVFCVGLRKMNGLLEPFCFQGFLEGMQSANQEQNFLSDTARF